MCTQEVKKLSSGHQVLMGEEGAGEEGGVGGGSGRRATVKRSKGLNLD